MNGRELRLRVIVDRTSIEAFADDGSITLAHVFVPAEGGQPHFALAGAGAART